MKHRTMKRVISTMIAAAMVCGLAGCSGNGGGTDTGADGGQEASEEGGRKVTYMVGQSNYIEAAFTEIAEKMKEEKGIEVEYQVTPDSQGVNLAQTKLASGEVPDLIQVNIPENYYTYNADDNFLELNDEEWIDRLTFDKSEIEYTDGNVYGMPITGFSGVMGVIYNKDVFEELDIEVPKTYDDFLAACEKIKSSGKTAIYISGNDSWTIQIAPMIYLANSLDEKAEDVYDELYAAETSFADIPEFKQALKEFQELFTKGYTNEDFAVATFDDSKTKVAEGEAAMLVSGEYAISDMMVNYPDANLGMFPLPYNDVDKFLTSKYVFGLSIPKSSKNVEAAKEFLETLSQPEYLEIYLNANPLNTPFDNVESNNINPVLKEIYEDYFNNGKMLPQIADTLNKFGSLNNDVFFPVYTQVAQGGDLDEAIEQFDSGLQEYGENTGIEAYQ